MLLLPAISVAQKYKRGEAVLRDFMAVCNGYRKAPLHAVIIAKSSADIITSAEDTVTHSMEFFVKSNEAVVKVDGNIELINDSVMLMIDNNYKRMMLARNTTGGVETQLNRTTGMFLNDSSVIKISGIYDAMEITGIAGNYDTIIMENRNLLPGTDLSKEMINVVYARNTKFPVRILQLHRKMIPLTTEEYNKLENGGLYAGKLVNTGKGYHFIIKELSTEYRFAAIDNKPDNQSLLKISDCVERDNTGKYKPTTAYAGFYLLSSAR